MASQLTGRALREFWLLTLGQFLLFCGFTMFFQFPLFIKSLGGGEREIGIIMGVATVLPTVLLPWFATMAGQVDRKRMMELGAVLVAVSSLACALLRAPDVYMALLMSLRGLGFVVYLIANGAYVATILPARERARWFSIYFAFWSIASAVGPGMGEFVILRLGYTPFFAISFAVLLAATSLTLGLDAGRASRSVPLFNPLWAMTHFFLELKQTRFRYLFVTLLCMSGAFSAVLTFTATYLRGMQLSSGVFFAAYALVAVASRFGGGGLSDRYGRALVAVPTIAMLAAGMVAFSFTTGLLLALVSAALLGVGWGLANPTISAQMIDRAPPQLQGVAVGGFQLAFNLGMLLCTPVFGFIAEHAGYPSMWRVSGGLMVVALLVYAFLGCRGEEPAPA